MGLRILGVLKRFALEVTAVGDDDDGAVVIAPILDGFSRFGIDVHLLDHTQRFADGAAEIRFATRSRILVHRLKRIVEMRTVVRLREQGLGGLAEGDERAAIVFQRVNEVRHIGLRPLETAWKHVARKHRTRDIDRDDDVAAPGDALLHRLAPLGT